MLEGAASGSWGLRPSDWVYQLGAYAAFIMPALLVLCPLVVAGLYVAAILTSRLLSNASSIRRACLGPLALVFTLALVDVPPFSMRSTFLWGVVFKFPIAFLGGAYVYGFTVVRALQGEHGEYAA
jgi:hypothetical protein